MRVDRILRATMRRRSVRPEQAAAEAARIEALPAHRLASGPGLVAAAFGLDRAWTGVDLCGPGSPLHLEAAPSGEPRALVAATARIGIDYAGEDRAAQLWRLIERGHRSVSGPSAAR